MHTLNFQQISFIYSLFRNFIYSHYLEGNFWECSCVCVCVYTYPYLEGKKNHYIPFRHFHNTPIICTRLMLRASWRIPSYIPLPWGWQITLPAAHSSWLQRLESWEGRKGLESWEQEDSFGNEPHQIPVIEKQNYFTKCFPMISKWFI